MSSLEKVWAPRFLSLLRVIAAALMMQHGAQKLFGVLGAKPGGPPPLFSMMGLAGVIEFFVAGLLLIGLFTRPAAFLLSGTMAVAYFTAHAPQGFWPVENRGELAVIYCFVHFYLFAAGGGPFSVDALLDRKRAAV